WRSIGPASGRMVHTRGPGSPATGFASSGAGRPRFARSALHRRDFLARRHTVWPGSGFDNIRHPLERDLEAGRAWHNRFSPRRANGIRGCGDGAGAGFADWGGPDGPELVAPVEN